MPFPQNIKEDVLVACNRHCSLCHKFCGTKIEVHHIKQEKDGGENTFDNAIALCFDCHADMTSYDFQHPKGNKYTENELRRQRDEWYKQVQEEVSAPQKASILSHDIHIYNKLLELLPPTGSVYFISINNFAGFSFDNSSIDELFTFDDYCRKNKSFIFFNNELEELRSQLVKSIDYFTSFICTNTFPLQGNRNTVPPEWEFEQPKRFKEVVETLHRFGEKIFEIHSEIINTAVKKLMVAPPL